MEKLLQPLSQRDLRDGAGSAAAVQMVVSEHVDQAGLAWGFAKYNRTVCMVLSAWTCACLGLLVWLWLAYVFAGLVCVFAVGFMLSVAIALLYFDEISELESLRIASLRSVGSAGVGIWAVVLGEEDADLKSWQSRQPWTWPLLRSPDSFATCATVVCLLVGYTFGMFDGCTRLSIFPFFSFDNQRRVSRSNIRQEDASA